MSVVLKTRIANNGQLISFDDGPKSSTGPAFLRGALKDTLVASSSSSTCGAVVQEGPLACYTRRFSIFSYTCIVPGQTQHASAVALGVSYIILGILEHFTPGVIIKLSTPGDIINRS